MSDVGSTKDAGFLEVPSDDIISEFSVDSFALVEKFIAKQVQRASHHDSSVVSALIHHIKYQPQLDQAIFTWIPETRTTFWPVLTISEVFPVDNLE